MNQLFCGQEHNLDAVPVGPRIHLDVGVGAGGEELFDGGTHVGQVQRLVGFQGKNVLQFGGGEGLLRGRRVEPDAPQHHALVLPRLGRRNVGLPSRRHEKQGVVGEQQAHHQHDSVVLYSNFVTIAARARYYR